MMGKEAKRQQGKEMRYSTLLSSLPLASIFIIIIIISSTIINLISSISSSSRCALSDEVSLDSGAGHYRSSLQTIEFSELSSVSRNQDCHPVY